MQRVLRFLLVCFLAAAMPLKGMAMVLMLAGGWMPLAGAAQVAPVHAAHMTPMAQMARMAHMGRYEALPADHAPPCASATTGHGDKATKTPSTPQCSACDACAAAAPLPAVPLHIAAPDVGAARFQPLAQAPVRFVTDGPDRPPRRHLA